MTTPQTAGAETDLDVAVRLRAAVTRLSRRLRQESIGGLTPGQASTLAMVARMGNPTLGELARAEQMQPPTMTRIISGMEALGLVDREIDQSDRRVARMMLTAKGTRELDRIRNSKAAFLAERLRGLDESELELASQLVDLLERIESGG
jgi:DNA-binding MarR family transcriptional regulator